MKTVFIIIAIVLVIAGIALLGSAFAASGFDFSNMGAQKLETNTYTLTEDFSDIEISTNESEIILKPSDDGSFRAVCKESEKMRHTVAVEDGTLKIGVTDTRKWIDRIAFNRENPEVTIYLPKSVYGSLKIEGHTGDAVVPGDFSFGTIDLKLTTGDVECAASVSGKCSITATTGDVKLNGVSAESIDLSVTTGHVIAENVDCGGNITLGIGTGKTAFIDVRCASLKLSGGTGDAGLKNVLATGSFDITVSTGDVVFDSCDASDIRVEASTGSITGTLRSGKIFSAKASTGKVTVPESTSGGKCDITTTTGNINIRVE